MALNAIVGFAGLVPTLELIKAGKQVALANKESLVCAGNFIDCSKIIPVDSEHFGAWYGAVGKNPTKITITASGGALRNFDINKIEQASIKEVLAHPNWSMGQKITVDSASMANKLFELLEARWLFGNLEFDAIIEPKSAIHAIVEFKDGASLLQASLPDMKLPIAYSLLGTVNDQIVEPIDWLKINSLEFKKICGARYPIWEIKDYVLKNPNIGCALNAANEVAVGKFLNQEIEFGKIAKIVKKVVKKFENSLPKSIDDIYTIDKEARKVALMD
ncbi:MAG: hypothetical protein RL154_713 [Pseudomonadota bacterium]|jgi:1-deoxy-D-xylulose-5-phosphate reductoisomerase